MSRVGDLLFQAGCWLFALVIVAGIGVVIRALWDWAEEALIR